MDKQLYQVVIGASWLVPADSKEEAIEIGKEVISEKGFAFVPSECKAVEWNTK